MYFTIGGRRTQGGLYRVTYAGKDSTRLAKTSGADRKSNQVRALRQKIEVYHGRRDVRAINTIWPHLDSTDRSIRYAARIAVESQLVEQWEQRALNETRKRAAFAALLAVRRCNVPHRPSRWLSDCLCCSQRGASSVSSMWPADQRVRL